MSVHSGTIGGDVGGHAVSIDIELVVCDRCEEQYVHTSWPGEAREGARASGWHDPETDGGEEDLCPDCKHKDYLEFLRGGAR